LRADARGFAVVRAIRFSSDKTPGLRFSATELGSQFLQQRGQFRVPGEISSPARTAKTLLHEEDLKVRE
jgi:hypothetical protein